MEIESAAPQNKNRVVGTHCVGIPDVYSAFFVRTAIASRRNAGCTACILHNKRICTDPPAPAHSDDDMEFNFNIDGAMTDSVQILKVDHTLTAEGFNTSVDLKNTMAYIIDEMGKLSAVAQEMMFPITSASKLFNSDQILYMMIEHNTSGRFTVVGILKMGWKKLLLYNKTGLQSEAMVYCLLDFYIHESKQRKGYGKFLIDYMLQNINLEAKHLVIDNPTGKLLQFMWKHYQLSKLVNQGNNFVIFEEFFDNSFDEKNDDNTGNRTSYNRQPTFGRHGAHKHHDTMGEIIQGEGNAAFENLKYNHDTQFVDHQFKEANPEYRTDVKQNLQFHPSAM